MVLLTPGRRAEEYDFQKRFAASLNRDARDPHARRA